MTESQTFDVMRALELARETLRIEAAAVTALAERLDERFSRVVSMLLACRGRVVVTGMGKSGHIGRKIAATLASTGTPSLFVHPAEASHGDLGMITAGDVVLAISNSGESEELTAILPLIRRMGVPLIAFTGRVDSTLGRHADVVLDTSVSKEACPHNLAPTASTTAQLALGDALAVALLDARGFNADDFARSHPGGALGRKLLTLVSDVMRVTPDVPRVGPDATLSDLMREVSAKGLGMTAVVDAAGRLVGIGSLLVEEKVGRKRVQGNMSVPAELLPTLLEDILAHGRSKAPPRPWLGLYVGEAKEGLVVGGVARGGPSERAGLQEGDVLLEVAGGSPTSLASFFRSVWRLGRAGTQVACQLAAHGLAAVFNGWVGLLHHAGPSTNAGLRPATASAQAPAPTPPKAMAPPSPASCRPNRRWPATGQTAR